MVWAPSLLIGLAAAGTLSLGLGAVWLSPGEVARALLAPDSPDVRATAVTIVWDLRLARVLLAAVVGAGLAGSGAAFQGMFRTPLADPFVIGASGGAALGATLAIIGRIGGVGVPAAAFIGAMAAVMLVYGITMASRASSATALLLAGASLSTVLSAIVSLLMLISDRDLHEIFSWLLGGLSGRSWPALAMSGPALLVGLAALWLLARPLDALTGGEEVARSLGLPLNTARAAIVAAASLTTAAAVAAGGLIGFIGLAAPHIARLFCGSGHARLIPASALVGALLLVLADSAARTVMAPLELPVGVLTALLGGPFFLWMLGWGGAR
ncbi:iron ABC transporter permease [Oscillochloris sp. ZM17-4]|nr:iron ABC transporter permease [Oscillochloris sp. ZM17-4]MBX0328240.1 iron ABC transporter permease [Oscillochloris sp. ZM17-4]